MCELEPIGPMAELAPGQSAGFTEDWRLLEYEFPAEREKVDLERVKETVEAKTSSSGT